MKNERPAFLNIYLDNEETLNLLTDADRGKLLSMLLRYAKGEEVAPVTDNAALAILFSVMTKQIDRDFAAYEAKCRRNRENAKKGGAPRGNQNAVKQETTENNPHAPKTTEEKEEEKEKEKEKEEEEEKEEAQETPAAAAAADVVALYHRFCPSMPKVRRVSAQREQLIDRACRALGGVEWDVFFRRVGGSDFLTGRSGKWKGCTFDWLLRPDIIANVQDGKYDNHDNTGVPPPNEAPRSYNLAELEKIDTLDFVDW